MNNKQIIEEARQRFDAELHSAEYKNIHSDDKHLLSLIKLFPDKGTGKYLDLGTGNGYVAFALSSNLPNAEIEGLDIAQNSIIKNNQIVEDKALQNICFKPYNGISLPYENSTFDGIISSYAFHHFPNVENSITELNRILKNNGFFILSDPITYQHDNSNFIDKFQKLKKDGHIHFYLEEEILDLFRKYSFIQENSFYNYVRYPRSLDDRYRNLISQSSAKILNLYNIEIQNDQVFIEIKVLNSFFRKTGNCL